MTANRLFEECSKRNRFTCDWIYNILVVLCDGKVVCGCADPCGERPLGNLATDSISTIWNSELVREIRSQLNQGHCCFCDPCGLKQEISADSVPPQRPVSLDHIPRIFFEPTINCNLSCFKAVCNKESRIWETRSRRQFPLEEFRHLMDEIGPALGRLDFFNYGEPFMHPQAVDMIEYVKERYPHVYVYTSTNGLMLNEEKIERLVKAGLDEITFSVDGVDQKSYGRYRQGGDFARVLQIMEKFVKVRNKVGREVPFVNWRYILFYWNDSRRQMNRARKLALSTGVDRLTWEITDHPPEGKSRKYQAGTRAWKRIYPEIWDSSQIGNAIVQKRFTAKIKPCTDAVSVYTGKSHALKVEVLNTGGAEWLKSSFSGRRMVRLGAQLYHSEKELADLNFARAFLNSNVGCNEKANIEIEIPPLPHKGEFLLKLDMVLEGVDWFESGGSPVEWIKLTVR